MNDDMGPPDTPKACIACGGYGCHWCDSGSMSPEQMGKWKEFRTKMRAVSGTYSMFQDLVESLVARLRVDGRPESIATAAKGEEAIEAWLTAEPDSHERKEAAARVSKFHKEAIDRLTTQ